MKNLTLYYIPTCPYSGKVLNYLENEKIDLELKNIKEKRKWNKELKKIGGKTLVPCLVIDGSPLYESDDIINWLKENY